MIIHIATQPPIGEWTWPSRSRLRCDTPGTQDGPIAVEHPDLAVAVGRFAEITASHRSPPGTASGRGSTSPTRTNLRLLGLVGQG